MITFSVNPKGDTKQYRVIKDRSSDIEQSYIGEFFEQRNDTGNIIKTFESFVEEARRKNGSEKKAELSLDVARNKSNDSDLHVSMSFDIDVEKTVAELFKIVFHYIEDQTGKNFIDLVVRGVGGGYYDASEKERADMESAARELAYLMRTYDDCEDILSKLRPDIDVIQVIGEFNDGSDTILDFSLRSFVRHFKRFETYFISK
ncbi:MULTISPECIES: hypothetical protein [Paenibacillaceae]|uniref:Uncharacterized protein n=1 Tax=Paenibacillus thailandensis TaxID=393250 RepID=A0ABW5QR61_9BACL|nr:hypothetical protein [Cohnella massiliensis]